MDKEKLKEQRKRFEREYLSLSSYIDKYAADINIRSNIPFKGHNIYILFVAVVIASVGLNVNSIPVIIGAMLISPLMGPIIGFGYGLGINDTRLLGDSLKNLGVMFVISLIASTLYFVLTPLDIDNPTELLARTNPSIYDVLIAFFGGVAGMLEISRKDKGTVLSGVAIATALMPPLCTVGYGIANWNWQYAGGALYLFFINSVFIALAAFLVTKYLKYPLTQEKEGGIDRRVLSYLTLILIVIVPSFFSGYSIIRENNFTKDSRRFVKANQSIGSTYIYDYTTDMTQKPFILDLRLAGEKLTPESREKLYTEAEKYGFLRSQLVFHEDATIEVKRLNETEIMRDWITQNEERLRQRDDSIRILSARLEAYEALAIPTEQVSDELRAQIPTITEVTIARNDNLIVVIVKSEETLIVDEIVRLENWLRVRLKTEDIRLIIEN